MGTLGLVPFFIGHDDGDKVITRGLAARVLKVFQDLPHMRTILEHRPLWVPSIDPELLKRTYDDMVTQAGAQVLFTTRLTAVEKSRPDQVETLVLSSKSGLSAKRAKVYVDCTGDGDLAAWAGAPFEKGDKDGHLQPTTLCFVIANVDDYPLLNGRRVHFYDPDSPVYKAIKSDKYPLIFELHSCTIQIGPATWGYNTGHVFDVDNTDPASVSKAMIHGRKMAAQYRDAFAEFLPEAFANSFLVSTGALLGARETRRVMGDYVLNSDDYKARRSFPDEISRIAYPIDIHYSREEAVEVARKSLDELRKPDPLRYKKGESMGIPYRCLTPKGITNLLVAGRCISTDRTVNGSIRIMPCCLNTGEAAGLAAALAAVGDRDVHHVNTGELRSRLKTHGAWLP
jgi:hypothetical protein